MPTAVQVLIVDQDADVRFGIRKQLSSTSLEVAGEASFGTEAVSQAVALSPDAILCALEDPLVRPIETIEALLNALPHTPIIVYSTRNDIDIARRAMVAGARDFLVRPFQRDDLVAAVEGVLGGEEERQRRAGGGRRRLGFRGTVLTVFSAKGGVGKTTFATNLAAALASDVGQSVAIIDADTSFGDVLVNMDITSGADITHLLRALHEDAQADVSRFLAPHASGARVLAPPQNPIAWSGIAPAPFSAAIEALARSHDYVVIDLAAAANPLTLAAIDAASLVLWLLTPHVTAIRDNMQALRVFEDAGLAPEKIRFIVNHPSPAGEVSVASIEASMHATVYWTVPYDRNLYRQSQLGKTVDQWGHESPGGRSVVALARTIAGIADARRDNARRRFRLITVPGH